MIDSSQVVEEVKRLAKEKPDFVYAIPEDAETCLYVFNGKGSCIVGQALINLGILAEDIAEHEGQPASDVMEDLLDDPNSGHNFWLDQVQSEQDGRVPWGKAVETATEEHPEITY